MFLTFMEFGLFSRRPLMMDRTLFDSGLSSSGSAHWQAIRRKVKSTVTGTGSTHVSYLKEEIKNWEDGKHPSLISKFIMLLISLEFCLGNKCLSLSLVYCRVSMTLVLTLIVVKLYQMIGPRKTAQPNTQTFSFHTVMSPSNAVNETSHIWTFLQTDTFLFDIIYFQITVLINWFWPCVLAGGRGRVG